MKYTIDGNKIIINEPLSNIKDITDLANELEKLFNSGIKEIILDMKNTYFLPSIILGKLYVLKDKGVNITIIVYKKTTYEFFNEIGLKESFNIIFKEK